MTLPATLAEISQAVHQGQLRPSEVVAASLEWIERQNPSLFALVSVQKEQAQKVAAQLDAELAAGKRRGPLHGVPVVIKDNIAQQGLPNPAGSLVLAQAHAQADAAVVERLAAAGAVIVGRGVMDELAFGGVGQPGRGAEPKNPHDPSRIPGGSSAGPAVAVASGMVPLSLGTDTGGSVRIPASLCGLVGARPSYGAISLRGVVPQAWSFDTVGPLTRSVKDAAIALSVLAGHDAADPVSQRFGPIALEGLDEGPNGLVIGLPRSWGWAELAPEVSRLCTAAVEKLVSAGARTEDVTTAEAFEASKSLGLILVAEAAAMLSSEWPSKKKDFAPKVAMNLEIAKALDAPKLARAMRTLTELRAKGDALFGACDVWVLPTVPDIAPLWADAKKADPTPKLSRTTTVFSMTGQPAVTVPVGLSSQGLPVGLTVAARRGQDSLALRVAQAVESLMGPLPSATAR